MKLLKDATIVPIKGSMDSFSGGVFSSDGHFMKENIPLYRVQETQWQEHTQQFEGVYLYGGCLFTHFGHYIWESLARLYAIRECKNYPILFIAPKEEKTEEVARFFKALGVRNKIIVVNAPALVENLIYPSPGSSLVPLYMTDEQIAALQHFTFSPEAHYNRKIWLSRSLLLHGRVTNERLIESALLEKGYEIIYPEKLPFREQVRVISTSSVVAGFWGSAFYSFLFAKEVKGTFFLFNRKTSIPSEYQYIFEKRGVAYNLFTFNVEFVSPSITGSSAGDNYIHTECDKVVEALP